MTHQSTGRRRWPQSRPRHASASRLPAPFRPPARATVRLLAAAGSILAGLCVVIGSVALVADVTALPSATHISAADGQQPAVAYLAPGGALASRRPCCAIRSVTAGPRVLARFTGQGRKRTTQFTIAGTWMLEWSFSCPARRQPGRFIVREAGGSARGGSARGGSARGGTAVDQTGLRGHGVTSVYAGSGVRYLAIYSACAWKVRVLTKG